MKINSFIINITFFLTILGLVILGCKNTTSENNTVEKPKNELTTPETENPLSTSELKIKKQDFGEVWAFTLDEGVLSCKGKNGIGEVLFTSNGKIYAVNGTAKSTKKYLPIEEIWVDDPTIKGAK